MGPQDDNVALVMDRRTRATKLANWRWTWGSHPWCRRSRLGRTRGSTTGRCTSDVNEVERLFRRLKGYRRIFSRFEKLDVMFIGFIHFVLIFDALR